MTLHYSIRTESSFEARIVQPLLPYSVTELENTIELPRRGSVSNKIVLSVILFLLA